jgi:hypothetical protein
MDYRELLKKYISHVVEHEGVCFLGKDHPLTNSTPEENLEIMEIANEVVILW